MKTAFKVLLFFTFLTGVIYPVLITGISQIFFRFQANGSLIEEQGKLLGSSLVGQNFKDQKYFWSRPSAVNYDPSSSGATNLAPTSLKLKASVVERKSSFKSADMLTSSASGLDPHLSPEAMNEQIERVARARGLSTEQRDQLQNLIKLSTEGPTLGVLGRPRVNVLQLNQQLDKI